MFHTILQGKNKGILPNIVYKAKITLIPKPCKETSKKLLDNTPDEHRHKNGRKIFTRYTSDKELITRIKKFAKKPVVHPCNPSYSEGRDQEDRSSKPAWENSL
jgi:hypothetical protein